MGATVYFSKINLNSHIIDVYNQEENADQALKKICDEIIVNFNDGTTYVREDETYKDDDGKIHIYDAIYKLGTIVKHGDEYNNAISGAIYKESRIFYKEMNEIGVLESKSVKNHEVITFYYDVYKEIVGFYTANRFGYKEFNEAFKEILNKCMYKDNVEKDSQYYFNVELYKKGLKLEEVRSDIKRLGKIKTLKVDITLPNANKEILNKIKTGEELVNAMQVANVTEKSTLLVSHAKGGMDLESDVVNEPLSEVEHIHPLISGEEALCKGYAAVTAETPDGIEYTTKEQKPLKVNISDEEKSRGGFVDVCKKLIASMF